MLQHETSMTLSGADRDLLMSSTTQQLNSSEVLVAGKHNWDIQNQIAR